VTPSRLRDCMILADMPAPELARRLGRPEADIRRWLKGEAAVPPPVASWLSVMAMVGEEYPAPLPRRRPVQEPEQPHGKFW
jgi:hypothetical protein